ncbi:MAG: hypothetical protein ACU837_12590 [Gammaproteobacteria bacterium]
MEKVGRQREKCTDEQYFKIRADFAGVGMAMYSIIPLTVFPVKGLLAVLF